MKGGKRPGSGRRLGSKNHFKRMDFDVSRQILQQVDVIALWKKILHSKSIKVAATGLMYLMDRVYGRPAQTIQGGSEPLKVEFSWNGTPEWMKATRVVEATQIEDKSEK